jgi:deoxycytidylate deaminase
MSIKDERRECFAGLIAPIGVDLDAVILALEQALKRVSYDINDLRLTSILRENKNWYNIDHSTEMQRYQRFIAAGDRLCKDSGHKDIFALYGIANLWRTQSRTASLPQEVMHVFRQLKRVEEIITLREIYGRNIMFLACYSSKDDRINYLVKKMLRNERGTSNSKLEARALEIIATDEDERDNPYGQRVIECYPHADFVIDCTTHESLNRSAERFVSIYFGDPFIAPAVDEYCSYIANAASYRSLDLSRQVGAALFGDHCELISLGCNEVPKAGGGTYWSGEDSDHRDYALGYDSNQRVREDMTRDALVRLQKSGWLSERHSKFKPDQLVAEAFSDSPSKPGPLNQSMVADVIEFGRMVHAEMNALTDAARFRRSTKGATLFCTTLPCHMCTKLVIASGVKRVVYVQPYGKSLIEELFPDSVAIDERSDGSKVIFETLKGVTPNGFKMAFHKKRRRKLDDGTALQWDPTRSAPTFLSTYPYYVSLEVVAKSKLTDALKKVSAVTGKRGGKKSSASTRPAANTRPTGG